MPFYKPNKPDSEYPSGSHRSGRNSVGRGYKAGSKCMAVLHMNMMVPAAGGISLTVRQRLPIRASHFTFRDDVTHQLVFGLGFTAGRHRDVIQTQRLCMRLSDDMMELEKMSVYLPRAEVHPSSTSSPSPCIRWVRRHPCRSSALRETYYRHL
jgi:hypothetical protein